MRKTVLTILATFVVFASASLYAQDNWPRFRGPDGKCTSDATTIPVKWTEKDYNWKVTLPGTGHSSPVIWGDRIFLTCANEKTALRIVCCISKKDGKLLWQKEYTSGKYRHNRDNSFASATPAVDANNVYATWTTDKSIMLLALDHEGREIWKRDFGPFKGTHGSGVSPIVFENLVILGNEQLSKSSIEAVDCATGKTRWSIRRGSGRVSYCTPYVYRPEGGKPQLLFTNNPSGLTSVDPSSGKINWKIGGIFDSSERFVASTIMASGHVFVTTGKGGRGRHGGAFDIRGDRPKLAYKMKGEMFYTVTPVAKGDLLFCATDRGEMYCLQASTGKELWRQSQEGGFYSSPILVGDKIYWITKKGVVVVIEASEKFKVLAKNDLGEKTFSTPAVSNGVMYIRTNSALISLGGK